MIFFFALLCSYLGVSALDNNDTSTGLILIGMAGITVAIGAIVSVFRDDDF